MFLLALVGSAQATTFAVGPGCDFYTIQFGIDAAMDGDTVLVSPGEYVITEPITFRGKAITVVSEAGLDETTIRMGTPADLNRGSVVVFEAADLVAARAFAESDPYVVEGIFASIEVFETLQVFPREAL